MEQYNSEMFFRTEQENVRAFMYKEYSIEPHTHDFYEINIVMSGKGKHIINNKTFNAVQGNVFVIPPIISHGYTDTVGLDVFHILLKTTFVENLPDKNQAEGLEMLMEIEPFLRQNCQRGYFLTLSGRQLVRMEPELLDLIDGGALDYKGSDAVKNHSAVKILYILAHYIAVQTEPEQNSAQAKKDEALPSVIKYIHENYKEKIYIEDLCRISYMSTSTLTRKFKQMCGITPMEYLRDYRTRKALQMMKENSNKTTIAQECGFYDLSHMKKSIKLRD